MKTLKQILKEDEGAKLSGYDQRRDQMDKLKPYIEKIYKDDLKVATLVGGLKGILISRGNITIKDFEEVIKDAASSNLSWGDREKK